VRFHRFGAHFNSGRPDWPDCKKFLPSFNADPPSQLSSIQGKMYWKVTLMRSGIGLAKRRNDTLVALGLRKRFRTVYKPVNPQTAGLLLRVKELIRLELVDDVETKEQQKEKRKPQKGYVVEQAGGTGYVSPMDALKIQTPSSL